MQGGIYPAERGRPEERTVGVEAEKKAGKGGSGLQ